MCKLSLILALMLALALLAGASAEGILPVLQTPPPEITETVSYHRMMNFSSTPSASSDSEGRYYYEYSGVTYQQYLDFGRALNQEGFAVSSFSQLDNGTGAAQVSVTKDAATLEIIYNADTQYLKVTYAPRLLAEEVDPDNPYRIAPAQDSILPELEQVISLHAVTGLSRPSPDLVSDGGYRYYYYNVPYAAYARFSVKLAEAGFTLVSSEKTEEGLDRAVVSDGKVQLTIDYSQEDEYAYVTYPQYAHARDRDRFGDYEVIRDGDTIETMENVKITFTGWEFVDVLYSSSYGRWEAADGMKLALIHMDVDFYRPETWSVYDLTRSRTLYFAGASISDATCCGEYEYNPEDADLNNLYDRSHTGRAQFPMAIGLMLTEEQAAHPEDIALSFFSPDSITPYVYYLQAPEA